MFLVQGNENKLNSAVLEDFFSNEKMLILVTMDLHPKAKTGGKLKNVGMVPVYTLVSQLNFQTAQQQRLLLFGKNEAILFPMSPPHGLYLAERLQPAVRKAAFRDYLVQAALGLQGSVQLLFLLHPHFHDFMEEFFFGFFCVQAAVQRLPQVLQLRFQAAAVGLGVSCSLVGAAQRGRGLHPRGAHVLGRAG